MIGGSPLLAVRGLEIAAVIHGRRRTIVRGVDVDVAPGETIGIVGESGSGKTMTARAIVGLLPAGVFANGQVLYAGRDLLRLPARARAQVRGSGISLLLQDPFTLLNPLMPVGRHIEETLRAGGGSAVTRGGLRAEVRRRLAEVGIIDPSVAERYPFQLSGGMRQRVGIAAALARNCRLLIADEPSTTLDVTTQKEILDLLISIQRSHGMGLMIITHNLRVAFMMCRRVYVMYAGSVLETAPSASLEEDPRHPYTLGLLMSEPPVGHRVARFEAVPGSVPAPDDVAAMCAFAARCRWADPRCRGGTPPLAALGGARWSACLRTEEIHEEMQGFGRIPPIISGARAEEVPAPLVRIEGLHKVYESRRARVRALSGVSMEIGVNESVGLVGESGSGKTTLGRCLVGLETPTAGAITIDGVPAANYDALAAADRRRLRRTIQMVFQDAYSTLNPSLTIGSILMEAVGAGAGRPANPAVAVRALLARVGLPAEYALRKPVALSGGERQRVAVARALAVQPKMLVCDEPVSALDVSVQAQILNLFRDLQEEVGEAFLFITHDLAVARQVTDRIYVLYRGEIVESGRTADVLDRPQHPYTIRLVESIPRSTLVGSTGG
jgi:peptide/nickel transport system ATP-binding protein